MHRSLTVIAAWFSIGAAAVLAQSPAARLGPPADITRSQRDTVFAPPLALKWDESLRLFDVAVANPDNQPINVYGVQTTAGLYVVDFPTVIPPKGQGTFTLLYAARPGVAGTADLLRVLTDRAEKVIQINHEREQAVQVGATSLQWQVGEPVVAKEVALTLETKARAVPRGVRAGGEGNHAELRSLGEGRYSIVVTPGSTSKPRQFPVFVEFDKAVPGAAVIVLCAVVPAN